METQPEPDTGVQRMRIVGGNLAIDFANTRVGPPGGPPNDDDTLVVFDDLVAWSIHVGAMTEAEATALRRHAGRDRGSASKALARALAIRDELDGVFRAISGGRQPAARSFDAIHVAEAASLARAELISDGTGFAWSWARDRSLDRPIGPVIHAAIELLTNGPLDRLKACRGCSFLFLDESKNRSRRWCSMEDCGTNEKMRRFVTRRAAKRLA